MKTTLLISTYNNADYLRLCLSTVLAQTIMPDEIVIADDGSTEETAQLIKAYAGVTSVPVKHVWHEDDGFRKCMILNKAIAASSGEYIIQIDGDVLLDRHFVEDHLSIATPRHWVNGSRVLLAEDVTRSMMERQADLAIGTKLDTRKLFNVFNLPFSSFMNSLRIRPLRNYMKTRYAVKKVDHMRGCNMAYWKADALAINGYNEDLTFWGHEDGEFVFRLHFDGVGKLSLKMGGNVFHMYHKPSSRENESKHLDTLEQVKRNRTTRCANGIDKYLEQA